MELPGLIKVQPGQSELKAQLTNMLGAAFVDEPWMKMFFTGIKANPAEALEFSTLIFRRQIELGCPADRVYCLPDGSAALIAYRFSEAELDNEYYEGEAMKYAEANTSLDQNHRYLITSQNAIMAPVSDFGWEEEFTGGADFIHLVYIGVDPAKQGQGLIRKLLQPVFDYADANRLPIFLETFSDNLQAMYEHLGFDCLQVLECDMPVKLSIDFGENAPTFTKEDIFRELEALGSGGTASQSAMGGMKLKKETVPFSERMMGRRPQFNLR